MGITQFFELSPWKNPPAAETILEMLWQLQDVCESHIWHDHNHPDCEACPCIFCEEIGGLLFNIRRSATALECAVYPCPVMSRRRAQLARERGEEDAAREYDQQADDMERNPPPVPVPRSTEFAPAKVLLHEMKEEAESAPEPVYVEIA